MWKQFCEMWFITFNQDGPEEEIEAALILKDEVARNKRFKTEIHRVRRHAGEKAEGKLRKERAKKF